jgi:hypothetical protein
MPKVEDQNTTNKGFGFKINNKKPNHKMFIPKPIFKNNKKNMIGIQFRNRGG